LSAWLGFRSVPRRENEIRIGGRVRGCSSPRFRFGRMYAAQHRANAKGSWSRVRLELTEGFSDTRWVVTVPAPQLSLIVPVYNESTRLPASLRAMGAYLAERPFDSEIVIVDDGSSDGTLGVAEEIARTLAVPVRLLRCAVNRGKGHALKVGFAVARGDWLVFTDCDLSTPLEEMGKFIDQLEAGSDLVIGSRRRAGADVMRHQPRLRENLGAVFTWIIRVLIADVTDVTCGFKAYRGEVGRDVFSRLRIDDWSFDAELLLIARERGYQVVEVPVRWQDHSGSKVRLMRDVVVSLIGIAKIHFSHALGRYDSTTEPGQFTEVDPCGTEPEPSSGETL